MSTKHKLIACIPHGDPDIGAEIECEITFTHSPGRPAVMYLRNGDPGYPADPAEIEFVSARPFCNGNPAPFLDFPDLQQDTLNTLAHAWLESEDGVSTAMDAVEDDDQRAREYAEEARAEMRREDR